MTAEPLETGQKPSAALDKAVLADVVRERLDSVFDDWDLAIAAELWAPLGDPAVRTDLLLACHAHRVARALDGSAPMSYGRPHRPTTGADRDERRRTTM